MNSKERESWFKNFIELERQGIADLIACLWSGENYEERLAYGSLEFDDDSLSNHLIQQFQLSGPLDFNEKFKLRLTYLPFSEKPLHVETEVSKHQIEQLKDFGIDNLLLITVKKALDRLCKHIIFRDKEKNLNNTYRELNNILYNTL